MVQDNDEFWMYDELKTRVADAGTLRNKFVSGSNTCKDKDSDKMISSRDRQVSHPVRVNSSHICADWDASYATSARTRTLTSVK